jgi:ProP effector
MDFATAKETIGILAELYPNTFTRERWQSHKPLKVGTDRDLIESGALTEPEVRSVLWHYCGRYQYFIGVANGGARYDLNGQPCGEVTADEQERARIGAAHVEAIVENQFRAARPTQRPGAKANTTADPRNIRAIGSRQKTAASLIL